jgi:RsiW-degrading membrane proteinase PrsW (M82 family)
MIYIIFIIFGLLPSAIWLLFYLRKDAHPESNRMILKIFFYGMVAALIAAVVEIQAFGILQFFVGAKIGTFFFFLLSEFILIALVEEASKFLIVKEKVVNHPEFDEPVDTMIYMIIVALGFAAFENFLVLSSLFFPFLTKPTIGDIALISSLRFLGATFLHALCSGLVGYFLALSFFKTRKRLGLIIKGLGIAALLHGLFNISIILIERGATEENSLLFISAIAFLIILLSSLAIFVSKAFRRLKKLKSICLTR